DNFGTDLDDAGDVNGDGYGDLVVGAPNGEEPGHTGGTGQIFVFSGKDGSCVRHFIFADVESGDLIGSVVAGIGDVNGDGFDDIGVGQNGNLTGANPEGRIWTCSLRFAVTGIEPTEVVYNKPTTVSISGHGFEPDSAIEAWVGDSPCTDVTWISSERVDCLTPGDGEQNTVRNLTFRQAGQTVPLEDSVTLAGTKVFSFFPPQGPISGHDILVIQGDHFVDDGTTTVKFGTPNTNFYATVLDVIEPHVLVVETPVGVTNLGGTMTVKSSAGTGDISHGYAFVNRWISPHTGNIAGGDVISVLGNVTIPPANDLTARIGNVPATILSAVPGRVDLVVPAVPEATGELLFVWLDSPTFGSQGVPLTFMYTPFAAATSSGNAFDGVNLALSVRSSTLKPQSNLVTLWVIDPTQAPHLLPPVGGTATVGAGGSLAGSAGASSASATGAARMAKPGGPSGTPCGAPLSLLAAHVPVPALASTFKLAFGATSPFLIGTTVWVQGVVTGEGNQYGSYTNPISFMIH
ncbi:MAG TPA: IPT/TIG domain-containing protein, partial [Planctomycetota bacterium]|nr:IPT/TIG domain-containing protein [Planctomycetota bacterium]